MGRRAGVHRPRRPRPPPGRDQRAGADLAQAEHTGERRADHPVGKIGADLRDLRAGDTFHVVYEALSADGEVLLLPHGYPCSSYAYRNLLPALGDTWRLVAPDLPGFGYSATPAARDFAYTFDAYAEFLRRFADAMELGHFALWLHDYGSQFGFALAMSAPERVTGLIIQNGDEIVASEILMHGAATQPPPRQA